MVHLNRSGELCPSICAYGYEYEYTCLHLLMYTRMRMYAYIRASIHTYIHSALQAGVISVSLF